MRSPFNFERAMRRRNVNVTELARLTERSRTSMSLIRSGRQVPSVETATAIERALDVDHGALFDFGDEPRRARKPGAAAEPDAASAS
jgi:transcriptional regulator with XRE-family HTH domain